MAAGQNVPACHFPADTGGEGGSVWFVFLEEALSSGQDRPCSTLSGAGSSGGGLLPQPVKTSHAESPASLSIYTHTLAHTHTTLLGKHINIFMKRPKRCSEGHRQEGEAVIWTKKKCVYHSSERGKEVWGHMLCYCNLFMPLLCSLQQHVKSGYWVETKCGPKNVKKRTLKLFFSNFPTVYFCLSVFSVCEFIYFFTLPVCW